MIYVGVTGQNGFIGKNLLNYLNKYPNKFKIIFFENIFFQNDIDLDTWVKKCNVIFHLAAISRHIDPKIVFKTNLELVKKIINSIQRTESKPHLIFTSSIHEERDTEYGKSKKQSRELFSEWSVQNKTIFTGFLLPNVFGPLAKPNYASVVATFSNNLIENKKSVIIEDSEMNLIYIDDLIEIFINSIENKVNNHIYKVNHTNTISVSKILKKLEYYYAYSENKIPKINSRFEQNLYDTLISYSKKQFNTT